MPRASLAHSPLPGLAWPPLFGSWPGLPFAQIGDFGIARSAIPQGYQWAEQSAPNRLDTVELPAQEPRRQGQQAQQQQQHEPTLLHGADSYLAMNEAMQVGRAVGEGGQVWLRGAWQLLA